MRIWHRPKDFIPAIGNVTGHRGGINTFGGWIVTRIFAMGSGENGELGDGTSTTKSSPVSVIGNHSFTQIFFSDDSSAALKSDGSMWTWGDGSYGQLGQNNLTFRSSPISVLGSHSFSNIVGNNETWHGLKSNNGSVWCWGLNHRGQIGVGDINDRSSPVSVVGSHSFQQLGRANLAVFGYKANTGKIWAWGADPFGLLAQGTQNVHLSSPVLIVGTHVFTKISITGVNHFAALKSDGSCWMWGNGATGQLGQGTVAVARSSPVSVVGAHAFADISVGTNFAMGLKSDGSVWCWGVNTNGELGQDNTTHRSSPVSVLGNHSFIKVWAVGNCAFGVKSNNSLWAWGKNSGGEFGDGTITPRSSPISVLNHFTMGNWRRYK